MVKTNTTEKSLVSFFLLLLSCCSSCWSRREEREKENKKVIPSTQDTRDGHDNITYIRGLDLIKSCVGVPLLCPERDKNSARDEGAKVIRIQFFYLLSLRRPFASAAAPSPGLF